MIKLKGLRQSSAHNPQGFSQRHLKWVGGRWKWIKCGWMKKKL